MADVFIVTGEASGDAIGAGIAQALQALRPGLDIEGVGSARMAAAGVRLWANSGNWAAMGIAQSVPVGIRVVALLRRLKRYLASNRPGALVMVDFGAFNVRLGAWAREHGIRAVYVVPPGSWRRRTRTDRLQRLAAAADVFLTPFPWNVENLRGVGAKAIHIGHPVLDLSVPSERATELSALRPPGGRLIALLPGSRRHEVETLVPLLLGVARAWPYPGDRFLVVRAPSFPEEELTALIARDGGKDAPRVAVTDAPAADAFAASDLGVICSGTATLEAAIAGLPMVVVYNGPALMRMEWRLRKRWLHVEHIAMPNVIAGRRIVTELLAEEATQDNVLSALRELAEDPARRETMKAELLAVRKTLEPEGALNAAANIILDVAGSNETDRISWPTEQK